MDIEQIALEHDERLKKKILKKPLVLFYFEVHDEEIDGGAHVELKSEKCLTLSDLVKLKKIVKDARPAEIVIGDKWFVVPYTEQVVAFLLEEMLTS